VYADRRRPAPRRGLLPQHDHPLLRDARDRRARAAREAAETTGDRRAAFWDEALRLRDLLKFEFFFPEREEFRRRAAPRDVALQDPRWTDALTGDPRAVEGLVRSFRPYSAHRVLQPFLELEPGADDLPARRAAFAEEVRVAARRAEAIALLAAARRAGLSP
jgi:glycerol-3-phosphate O-acyltransferase